MTLENSRATLLSACVAGMLVMPAQSKPIITAVCEEPAGPRIDFGGPAARQSGKPLNFSNDSFTGVNPTFIIDDSNLNSLTYIFGNTKPATGPALSQRAARLAHIVVLNNNLVSAIETTEDAVALFSLYPVIGLGFFTFHEAKPLNGANAKAVTFVSKCSFAN